MSQPARRRVSLTLPAEQLEQARAQRLDLSKVLEDALAARLSATQAQQWQDENREAIEHHNRRIERDGLWHRGLTPWY